MRLIKLIAILFLAGCSRTFYVSDTKVIQEQYLSTEIRDKDRVVEKFREAGFEVRFQYNYYGGSDLIGYIVLTPEMIEYTKNGKGILKKRHIKQLKNTL